MNRQAPAVLTNDIPVASLPDRLSVDTSSLMVPSIKLPFGQGGSLSPTSKSHFKGLPPSVLAILATDTAAVASYCNGNASTLVVDIRPFNFFSTSRLHNAYNVCVPTTLLKRPSYDLQHVLNSTSIPSELKNKVIAHDTPMHILIYDGASNEDHVAFALYQTVHKFLKYDCFSVAYLNGGFQSVDALLVDCTATLPQRSPISPVTPNSAVLSNAQFAESSDNHMLPLLAGFTLPSATASSQKFLMSIKKNLPRIDTSVKYSYNFRLPADFASKKDRLPQWLAFFAENYGSPDYSKVIVEKLSANFNKLEKSEQVRLNMAISSFDGSSSKSPHYHACTPQDESVTPLALCPCCDLIEYTMPKGIENGHKNRYNNIWPYEHSRVRLVSSPSCTPKKEVGDDYFNANYIDFPKLSLTKYIATQSPLEATREDFWNTVWYNGVKGIVCLNNPLPMAPKPYYEEDVHFSKSRLDIKIGTPERHAGFVVREVTMTKHDLTQTVFHFAYSEWPDFGTPDNMSTIFELHRVKNEKVNLLSDQHPPTDKIPKPWELLVHCSAGCGRTGCYITMDMVLDCFRCKQDDKYDPWGKDDLVFKSVQFQRQQRISMVQNLDQFIFCYESILNYVVDQLL